MKVLFATSACLLGLVLAACGGDSSETDSRVDDLEATIASLEEDLGRTEEVPTEDDDDSPTLAPPRATATARPTNTPEPSRLGLSRSSPVPVGQPLVVPDGWEITVLSSIPDAWPIIQAENQFNDPPQPGNRFMIVRIRGKNVSAGDPESFLPSLFTNMVGSSGVGFSATACGVIPDDFFFLETELFTGGQVEGNICFEVPTGETNLVLYTDAVISFDDDEKRWFAVP